MTFTIPHERSAILISCNAYHLWPPSAAQAARVSRLWFGPATDNLWGQAPLDYLSNVEAGRRQIYASKLQQLSLNFSEDAAMAKGLQFPRIQSIDFHESTCDTDAATYEPFRSCPISAVSMSGLTVPDAFFRVMAVWWPKISKVEIIRLVPTIDLTPDGFVNFVSSLVSLESLSVSGEGAAMQAEGLFPHCATRAELTSLRLPVGIPSKVVESATSQNTNMFKSLKELELTLPSKGFALMLGALQNLTALRVTLTSVTDPILSSISSLTTLTQLMVTLPPHYDIPRSELMSLRSLSKMRKLCISHQERPGRVHEVEDVELLDFIDDDFEQLFSHFPDLDSLTFICDCTLSARALACLADHCPHLDSLLLPSDIDLRGLQLDKRTTAAFPSLQWLSVESLSFSQATQDKDSLAKLFEKHFPMLSDLTVRSKTRGYRKIASSPKSVRITNKKRAVEKEVDLVRERGYNISPQPLFTWLGLDDVDIDEPAEEDIEDEEGASEDGSEDDSEDDSEEDSEEDPEYDWEDVPEDDSGDDQDEDEIEHEGWSPSD